MPSHVTWEKCHSADDDAMVCLQQRALVSCMSLIYCSPLTVAQHALPKLLELRPCHKPAAALCRLQLALHYPVKSWWR